MGWGEVASAELQSKSLEKYRLRMAEQDCKPIFKSSTGEAPEKLVKRRAVVLDMGEASREQGFRLNGCR